MGASVHMMKKQARVCWFVLLVGVALLAPIVVPETACGMGTEEIGSKPLSPENYKEWPGVAALVNSAQRVYHTWVNGNEHFYYRGSVAELNKFLEDFARAKVKERLLIWGEGKAPAAETWIEKERIPYNWMMHVSGGLVGTGLAQGMGIALSKLPVAVTVYRDSLIAPDRLVIPKGLRVVKEDWTKAIAAADGTTGTVKVFRGNALSEREAAMLGARLANKKCSEDFKNKPFSPSDYPAVRTDRGWQWGKHDPAGVDGYSAEVQFGEDGSNPEVEVLFHTDKLVIETPVEKGK